VSAEIGWGGRGQQLGTHIGTVWTLAQALGPAKENKYALESLDGYIGGYIARGCWELKRKSRVLPSTARAFAFSKEAEHEDVS
jgi:hypothetical protein